MLALGVEVISLADLVLRGEKNSNSSAMTLRSRDETPSPRRDLDLRQSHQAVCIVEITARSPSIRSADHAYKEGEGDKSLAWLLASGSEDFFKDC